MILSKHEQRRRQKKYRRMLPIIRETAQKQGYAIGVHGSERRDFDLIAAPWAENAVSAPELAQSITEALRAAYPENPFIRWIDDNGSGKWPAPAYKPFGRVAFTIITGKPEPGIPWAEFIDLSIMPKGRLELEEKP